MPSGRRLLLLLLVLLVLVLPFIMVHSRLHVRSTLWRTAVTSFHSHSAATTTTTTTTISPPDAKVPVSTATGSAAENSNAPKEAEVDPEDRVSAASAVDEVEDKEGTSPPDMKDEGATKAQSEESPYDYSTCSVYRKRPPSGEPVDDATGVVPPSRLSPRYYLDDSDCTRVGGWKHDKGLSEALYSDRCDVDRVDITQMTGDIFELIYRGKLPIIFVDPSGKMSFKDTKKYLRSIQRSQLLKEFGNSTISTSRAQRKDSEGKGYHADPSAVGPGKTYLLSEYLSQMDRPWSQTPEHEQMSDYVIGSYRRDGSIDELSKRNIHAPFLTKGFMNTRRMPHRRLFVMGATGSGSNFHRHGTAWSHQFYGMKRWFVRPPKLVLPTPRTGGNIRPTSLMWYHGKDPWSYQGMRQRDDKHTGGNREKSELLECVQMPGETFYLPPLWWHSTLNIAQSVSVAQFDFDSKTAAAK